jgi:hypothetical protein
MDLETLAFGVVKAGCDVLVTRPETRGDDMLEALIEVVSTRAQVSAEVAYAAVAGAIRKLQDRSCN